MNISDHDIQAYIDGELASDDAARIETAMAADVMVAARVERAKRLRSTLRGAYDPVLDEAVPERLLGLLASGAASQPVDGRVASGRGGADPGQRRGAVSRRWRVPAVAMAASVAVLAVSMLLRPGPPVQMRGGVLVAHGTLARELDRALAGQPDAAAVTSVALTFRDVDGRVCRSFSSAELQVAGLACRDAGRWTLPVLSQARPGPGAPLRQASGALPAEVQAAVDARLDGEVFDAEQERAARDGGWR